MALSVSAYFIHYLIFRDIHHTLIRMIGDLAFLLLEVLLVVVLIEHLLARREMQPKLEKLDMVVGALDWSASTRYCMVCSFLLKKEAPYLLRYDASRCH